MAPLLEYKCLSCDFQNDELVRSEADVPEKCPSCGSEMYEKQISAYGGYTGSFGGGSTPRRGAGSFKRSK